MAEERRELDPTRRMLKVFGVKVTDYEERTARLLERAGAATAADELLYVAKDAIELTADLNQRLREMTTHILDMQSRVLGELRSAIEQAAERPSV